MKGLKLLALTCVASMALLVAGCAPPSGHIVKDPSTKRYRAFPGPCGNLPSPKVTLRTPRPQQLRQRCVYAVPHYRGNGCRRRAFQRPDVVRL